MKLLPVFLLLALVSAARADDPLPLRDALARPDLRGSFTAPARDQIVLAITNSSTTPISVAIPAGAICVSADHAARFVILQSATLTIEPKKSAEAVLPAAALSSKITTSQTPLQLSAESEPRLDPLLKRLAGQRDLPRTTAQFAIFCLLEDMTFSQWQQFLAVHRPDDAAPETQPTPAEVAQAIDVFGLLRAVAPTRTFALATDSELKLRALRNPWCRAKAMQLYGVTLTGDAAEAGLPNLGQLLHTKANDNCPICRQRAEMQGGASDF